VKAAIPVSLTLINYVFVGPGRELSAYRTSLQVALEEGRGGMGWLLAKPPISKKSGGDPVNFLSDSWKMAGRQLISRRE